MSVETLDHQEAQSGQRLTDLQLIKTKKALDEETERRRMEEPNLRKLLEDRMDMMVTAVHSAINVLREELNTVMPLKEKVED